MKYLETLRPLWKPARAFLPWVLLGAILIVAFYIRIQSVPNIPEGQFTGNDPYLYYWRAEIVSEQGGYRGGICTAGCPWVETSDRP